MAGWIVGAGEAEVDELRRAGRGGRGAGRGLASALWRWGAT